MQHVSTMASLQELSLARTGAIAAATLPGIERLTALQDLSLDICNLEPSCLLPITTGLKMLHLGNLAPQAPEVQQDGLLGTSQLLQLLARLCALRVLTLLSIQGKWPQQLSTYSALTASSNLQRVFVSNCNVQTAAWAHVFLVGRKLPQLHYFCASCIRSCSLGSTGIARLVSCCPSLKDLHVTTQPDASLAPLQSLTALTSLEVGPVSAAAIRSDLAALSQLQSLQFKVAQPAPGPDGVADS